MHFDLSHSHPLVQTIHDKTHAFRRGMSQFACENHIIQIGIGADERCLPEITVAHVNIESGREFEASLTLKLDGSIIQRELFVEDEAKQRVYETLLSTHHDISKAHKLLDSINVILTHPNTIEVMPGMIRDITHLSAELSQSLCLKYVEMGFLGDPMESLGDEEGFLDIKIDGQFIM